MGKLVDALKEKNRLNKIESMPLDKLKAEKPMTPRNLEDQLREGDVIAFPATITDETFLVQPIGTGKAVLLPVMVYRAGNWRAQNIYPTAFTKMVNVAAQPNGEQWEDVGDYRQSAGTAAHDAQNSVSLYAFFENNLGKFVKVTKMHKEMCSVVTKFENGTPSEYGFKNTSWFDFDWEAASPTPGTDPYTL